jgi:hypothetical protein
MAFVAVVDRLPLLGGNVNTETRKILPLVFDTGDSVSNLFLFFCEKIWS